MVEEFAKVSERWKVITVHGSASLFEVFRGTSYNFGVLAKASHFSESILRKLMIRDSELKSIVVLRDELSASADACEREYLLGLSQRFCERLCLFIQLWSLSLVKSAGN